MARPRGRDSDSWFRLPEPSNSIIGWVAIIGLLVAVIGLYPVLRPSSEPSPPPVATSTAASTTDIELIKVSAEGTQKVAATDRLGDRTTRSEATAAVLDLRVRNRGDISSAITDLGVRVDEVLPVSICHAVGGFDATTGEYDVRIPEEAREGEEFTTPAAQSIKAGETDRFSLKLGADGAPQSTAAVYRLAVFALEGEVRHDLGPITVLLPPTAKNLYRTLGEDPLWVQQADQTCIKGFLRELSAVVDDSKNVASGVRRLLSDVRVAADQGPAALAP